MSLTGDEINLQLTRLHRDIQDLKRENRELKDMLLLRCHTHHCCTERGACSKKDTKIDELVEDFLKSNPDYPEVEELIQNSNIEDYLKHGR